MNSSLVYIFWEQLRPLVSNYVSNVICMVKPAVTKVKVTI